MELGSKSDLLNLLSLSLPLLAKDLKTRKRRLSAFFRVHRGLESVMAQTGEYSQLLGLGLSCFLQKKAPQTIKQVKYNRRDNARTYC